MSDQRYSKIEEVEGLLSISPEATRRVSSIGDRGSRLNSRLLSSDRGQDMMFGLMGDKDLIKDDEDEDTEESADKKAAKDKYLLPIFCAMVFIGN